MAKKLERNIITGLDIGTSKVVALIGEITPQGTLEIKGTGIAPSRGLKRGVVVDIDSTVQSIQNAVQEAESIANCAVRSVYTSIAGSHVRSLNSHGIVAIRDKEVSQADVERVIDAAKAVAIPNDQKILHVLPQEFIIDGQDSIREPIGMSGVRLETRVHIVTGAVSAAQNIIKCIRRCGLEVNDVILEQLASSHAVLTDDEKDLGVCLVDIGGGTTDIAIFVEGAIQHTAVIPIAGDQVTNDIAMALRTPAKSAEALKQNSGCAVMELVNATDMVDVFSVQDRPERKIAASALTEVIAARYEELFRLVRHEILKSGFAENIAAGIVLTGGASKIKGILQLAESCFDMPVRCGLPYPVVGLGDLAKNPALSTGVGLLLHGLQQQYLSAYQVPALNDGVKSIWTRMKKWVTGNF